MPEPVSRVARLMSSYGAAWFLCGGWAVDAWLGRPTRDHLDVDIAVFEDDQRTLFEHLAGWDLIGHDDNVADDCPDPWTGHRLDVPGHIHANSAAMKGVELDIQLNERANGDWIFKREPRITRPLGRCGRESAWDLPTATPEVVLFYKAIPARWRDNPTDRRPHDEHDLRALLPVLSPEPRAWLAKAIALADPAHPWLTHLGL